MRSSLDKGTNWSSAINLIDSFEAVNATNRIGPLIRASILAGGIIVHGAEVRVQIIQPYTDHPNTVVNIGDTVTWAAGGPSNIQMVESYTGEFRSPYLVEPGAAFSFTFQHPELFAYHHQWSSGPPTYQPIGQGLGSHGTITVLGWTNSPPAVTINAPLDGFHFGWSQDHSETVPILVSVTNTPAEIDHVEFYSGTNFLGTTFFTPYQFYWSNAPKGTNLLTAHAVSLQGSVAVSRPVTIVVEETRAPRLLPPRILNGRLLAFDYTVPPYPLPLNFYVQAGTTPGDGEKVKWVTQSGIFIS